MSVKKGECTVYFPFLAMERNTLHITLFLRAVAGDDSINSASAAPTGPPALSGKWPCVHLASVIL